MRDRLINGCQQVEREFTEQEWHEFIDRARELYTRGEFIHNEFYAKLEEHPEIGDADVLNTISRGACLVAYQNEGLERVALWQPRGRNVLVIATLDDGIITSYSARNFDRSLSTRTNVRRLWWPQ